MIKQILLTFLLYIYVNNPFFYFWGGRSSHIIMLPLLLFLFSSGVRQKLLKDRHIIIAYFAILIFSLIRSLLGGDFSICGIFISQFISNILYAYIIIHISLIMKIDLRKVIIYVGIISVILSIICLINPQFNSFVKTSLIKFGDEISLEFAEKNTYRGFGIASGLFYDYGIILALFYTYCLYLKKYKEIWFFLLVPFLIVAILLNARTGIIVVGFSTIIYLLFKKTGFKFVGIELLLLFFFFASVYASLEEGSQLFIDNFFANVDDVFALGKDSDMSNVYFDKMIILPRSIDEWIIGRGYMIFGKTGESSDVGYIIQLNYGGLLFMALLLPVCVILIKKIKDPYFAVTTIIVMLIANLKGNFFFNSGCYRYLTFLILLESYLNSSNQNSNNIRRNYLNRKRAINNLNNEGISNKP